MKMKLISRYIVALAVAFVCVSCSIDDDTVDVREFPIEVTLGTDMTKVGISGEKLFWQNGDQVAVRVKGATGESAVAILTLNDVDSGQPKAKFKGSVTMTEAPVSCEFAYPATAFDVEGKTVFDYSVQDGTHNPYLYGKTVYSSYGMNCTLGHVGGLIRLKVADGVDRVTLSSNSGTYTVSEGQNIYVGQKISKLMLDAEGEIMLDEEDNYISPSGSDYIIEVSVPVTSDNIVYVFMPAIQFTEGFTIVCHKGNDKKMFKSYSSDDDTNANYTFTAGTVIDLDMSEFVEISADCKVEAKHIYDKNILDGTEVKVTDFKLTGIASKIIDNWGVAVYDENEVQVRTKNATGAFKENADGYPMIDYTENWPLLFPGDDYEVYAICQINGQTLRFKSTHAMVVPDDLKIEVKTIAETSWNNKDNTVDNSSIIRLGLSINVSNGIINHQHTDYGFNVLLKNTTTDNSICNTELRNLNNSHSDDDVYFDNMQGTNIYELKKRTELFELGNLEWKAHNITSVVEFNGKFYSSSVKAYVTGLPYRHDFTSAEGLDGGSMSSTSEYHQNHAYRLYYRYLGGETKIKYTSRSFAVPENDSVIVKYSTTFYYITTGWSTGTATLYTGLTTSETKGSMTVNSQSMNRIVDLSGATGTEPHTVTGEDKMLPDSQLSAYVGDVERARAVENGIFMTNMEILYK